MALSTKAELRQAIKDWSGRRDLSDTQADEFILLTEEKMDEVLRAKELYVRAFGFIDAEYQTLPDEYVEMDRVLVSANGQQYPLDYYTPRGLMQRWASPGATGVPKGFSIIGKQIQFKPIADDAYEYELNYWRTVPRLTDTEPTNTNVILATYPQLYLAGCLVECATFFEEQPMLQTWASRWGNQLAAIDRAEGRSIVAGPQKMRGRHQRALALRPGPWIR